LPPRWVVVVSVATGAAILGDSLLYAVLPVIWADLGLQAGMVGLILSANRFVRILTNPVAGWVVGRIGIRLPFVVAVFVAAATTLAYGLGLGIAVFLVARALWGACWSVLRLGGYLAALEDGGEGRRGYYLGFFSGVTRAGSLIAVATGGLLTDLISFEATVFLFAGVGVVAGLLTLREHPHARTEPRPAAAQGARGDPAPHVPQPRVKDRWGLAIGSLFSVAFLHGMAISGLVTATLGFWLVTLYGERVDLVWLTAGVATVTGLLLGARFLFDAVWGPVSGHLSDRWGRLRFTLGAGFVQFVALLLLGQAWGLLWTVVAALILFVAATSVQVSLDATAGDLALQGNRSRVMSWYATSHDLGAATGPLVGYFVGIGIGLGVMYPLTAAVFGVVGAGFTFVQLRYVRHAPARVPAARH
jgi:MFS transporter, DHA1 family, multidrug resistance protein